MRTIGSIVVAIAALGSASAGGDASGTVTMELRAFPLQGPLEGLEAQVLDFRYAPYYWQTCIGLPDDPHKSIVGRDGGLYYEYGGGPYRGFKTCVRAELAGEGAAGTSRQSLAGARVPIVTTEVDKGELTLRQEAWAAAPESPAREEWSARRNDTLLLTVKNRGAKAAAAKLMLKFEASTALALDATKTCVRRPNGAPFAVMSAPCRAEGQTAPSLITLERTPGVNRNWANPTSACDARFRDVCVGWQSPLILAYKAQPGKSYRAAFGLIEGWHQAAGKRPLVLEAEGRAVRTVDLVKEFGRNVPVVIAVDAKDENGDGMLTFAVRSPGGVEDTNTILSALWIFDAVNAPREEEIRAGGVDGRALAIFDARSAAAGASLTLAALDKTLAPGEEASFALALPQGAHAPASFSVADAVRGRAFAAAFWEGADLPYGRIQVPDPEMQDLLDGCIRNIYQAREFRKGTPAFQVGPTCYRGTWAADGPFILEAVTYLGRASEARAGIETQVDGDDGPGGVEFSKKSGLRLWMVWRHAQLTGDRAWLERMWPRVEREVAAIKSYRDSTRSDPAQANFGLMPEGFGDGGLGGKHKEYTNVYWTLAGLRAAIEAATLLGKPCRAAWQAEYDDYWQAFDRARNRDKLADAKGNVYVPVTMKGAEKQLPQRGAWAFMQAVFPGRVFRADDALMQGTMAMLDADVREGLIYGTGWIADGVWNYAASFYAHAHLWNGHGKKAASTLYAFGNHASPLLCWREEQNVVGAPYQECGDMPHNWASGELIRLVRHLLVLERGNELHLLEGLPAAWVAPCAITQLTAMPTAFGDLDLELAVAPDARSAVLRLNAPRREKLERVVVHLEQFPRAVVAVRANGAGGPALAGPFEVRPGSACELIIEFAK